MARKKKKPTLAQINSARIKAAEAKASAIPDFMQPMSLDEIRAMADRMAQQQAFAQQTAIRQQLAMANESAKNRANAAGAIFTGLGASLGRIGPQIQSAYQQASDSQTSAAQGFSNTMRDIAASQAASDNAFIQSQGGSALPGRSSGSDALYAAGGYIPGSTFAREGASWGAYGATLPAAAAAMGRQQVADIQRAGAEATAPFMSALAESYASLPGQKAELFQSLLANQQENYLNLSELQLRQRAAEESIRRLRLEERGGIADITGVDPETGLPTYDAQLDAAEFAADTAAAQADARADQQKAAEKRKSAKQKAAKERNEALVKARADLESWVEKQKEGTPGEKPIVGYKPPRSITVPKDPAKGIYESQVKWYTKDGTLTDDPSKAYREPIYGEAPVNKQTPQAIFRQVLQRLQTMLKGYGIKPGVIRRMATEIAASYTSSY